MTSPVPSSLAPLPSPPLAALGSSLFSPFFFRPPPSLSFDFVPASYIVTRSMATLHCCCVRLPSLACAFAIRSSNFRICSLREAISRSRASSLSSAADFGGGEPHVLRTAAESSLEAAPSPARARWGFWIAALSPLAPAALYSPPSCAFFLRR